MQKFEYPAKVLITTMENNLTEGRRTLIALAAEQYLNLRQGFKDKNLGMVGVRVHLSMRPKTSSGRRKPTRRV